MNVLKLAVAMAFLISFPSVAQQHPQQSVQAKQSELSDFDNAVAHFKSEIEKDRLVVGCESNLPFLMLHPQKTKRSILLIHGNSDSPETLRELGKVYFEQGYNVVSIRLTGHGTSIQDLKKAKLADWRRDVERGAKTAAALSKSGQISMMGHSLGGALAIDYAHKNPDQVSDLVLLAPVLKVGTAKLLLPFARPLAFFGYTQSKKDEDCRSYTYDDFAASTVVAMNPLLKENMAFLKKKGLHKRTFLALTDSEKVVDNAASEDFAKREGVFNVTVYRVDKTNQVSHFLLPNSKNPETGRENPAFNDMVEQLKKFMMENQQKPD